MAVIDVTDVSRWYGEVIGLSGATLHVDPGVTGLLGPNGAGKSTLLKVLTGQIRASRGEARILGRPVWDNPDLFEVLGYCPEADALYTDLTAMGFLEALARLAGKERSAARRTAHGVLERVGLDPDLRKPIGAYSKGMRQRVKLAQALLHEPQVLLLDEPLNGLDPVGRQAFVELIRDFGGAGGTVLVSSHILHEVESMTSNVVLLHQGKVVAHGEVAAIRDLIEDRALSVRVRCRDAHHLAARLIELEDVQAVRFDRDADVLVVETARADSFFDRLTELGMQETYGIREVQPLDDDLQSVFDYLVR